MTIRYYYDRVFSLAALEESGCTKHDGPSTPSPIRRCAIRLARKKSERLNGSALPLSRLYSPLDLRLNVAASALTHFLELSLNTPYSFRLCSVVRTHGILKALACVKSRYRICVH